ncbi:MAG: AMP-binding protein [Treponema sp.]|nr:AMP-binding protein [Treponema sp.]
MKSPLKIFSYVIVALYPVLIFTFLVILRLPVRVLSLCIVFLALSLFIALTGQGIKKRKLLDWRPLLSSVFFISAGLACYFTNEVLFLKFYPVAVNLMMLTVFCGSLFFKPSIIFRIATLADKTIKGSAVENKVEAYCNKVCIVWCIFFVFNGCVSLCTIFSKELFGFSGESSDMLWSVYNGGISYILMGLLFAIEFIIRKRVCKKMPEIFSITKFKNDSRSDDYVLCYEGTWSLGIFKTWKDFLSETARMRKFISTKNTDEWILHCEDYWYFLVTFTALLQTKKRVHLTQNITENFLEEIKKPGMEFLTDQETDPKFNACFIPSIIESDEELSEAEIRTSIPLDSSETKILMYTSGSTGKPKAVPQRMKEFEEDNAFIIRKWSSEFLKRKLVTTVSQHHIYGFLFGISLPFTLGVPFRRKRIEYPEEFESLTDGNYMIIATPAFLKRTVEIETKLPLENCFIFTSGGAVSPDLAVHTEKVFGFCPLEVYGSTETSGIAYRQQKYDELEWTPFDNAKIWKGDDGCLRIISPYIKDPEGFATADLVDIHEDGKFILKGRSDSIVKIEEKRISMTEVENRLLETNLVHDVKVIALESNRQYLAAVIELNAEGNKKFEGEPKLVLNKYFHDFLMKYFENVVIPKKWRFVEKIPVDVQGKKHVEDIKKLFEKEAAQD